MHDGNASSVAVDEPNSFPPLSTLNHGQELISINEIAAHHAASQVDPKAASASILNCWSVLGKTIVGVGLLGLAHATAICGWVVGLLMLVISCAFSYFTLHLINCMIHHSGRRHVSYYTIASHTAPYCRWFLDVTVALKSLGIAILYLQVYGSQITSCIIAIIPSSTDNINRFSLRAVLLVVGVLLVSPFCFRQHISQTAIVNICGMVGIFYVILMSIVFIDPGLGPTSVKPTGSFMAVASRFPLFIFSFTCHQNMFLVAEDMKDRTPTKLNTVAGLAQFSAFCLFLPAIIFPYVTYGSSIKANFLDSMNSNPALSKNAAIIIGSFSIAVAEICTFPLQLFPCRKSIIVLISAAKGDAALSEKATLQHLMTACILVTSLLVAVFVDDVGIVLALVGTFGSNTISFIMPSFLYCKVFNRSKHTLKWKLSAVVFFLSCILLPFCSFAVIYNSTV